jgi:hypothetical protein
MYAKIRDFDATVPAGIITTWNIDYDACRAVNGEAGVVQLRAFNDIEAQGEFTRYMRARGHSVRWVKDFEQAWAEAQCLAECD